MSSILYIYSSQEFDILRWCYMLIFGYLFLLVMVFVVIVTGTGIWLSQVPVETWYNEQLEIVGGDGNIDDASNVLRYFETKDNNWKI